MKWLFFLLLFVIFFSGCDMRNREQALDMKEAELNQKEQALLVKEKSIQLKEVELFKREKLLDSTSNKTVADTLAALHPAISGLYNVTMRCTETTCAGSAVGDTKNEQLEIIIQNNTVIVKAMSDKKVVRIYSGSYVGDFIELIAQQDNINPQTGKMVVRLQETKEKELEGQREIIRPEDCRIVYSLELKKQQSPLQL